MRRRRPQAGLTLIEIMISIMLLMLGLLVILRAITSSITGSSFASQTGQAQQRASAIIEAIRNAPTTSLTCLNNTVATSWATCEADCRANQTGAGATLAQSCIFTPAAFSNIVAPLAAGYSDQRNDRNGQQYGIVYSNAIPQIYRTSFVRQNGPGNRMFDIQVTVGWNSTDGTANGPNHYVTLRSGVFN